MATVTKAVLKTYFEQGDIPTQGQYVDLIDSQFGLGETGTQIIQGTVSASAAEFESMTMKKLHLPGNGVDSMKVGTTFQVGRTLEAFGSLNLNILYKSGSTTIVDSGSFSASGDLTIKNIMASGDITAEGNISGSSTTRITCQDIHFDRTITGSGTSTSSFGRIEVADRIGHHDDQNTAIDFESDTVTLLANNVRGLTIASAYHSLGSTGKPTQISGSTLRIQSQGDTTLVKTNADDQFNVACNTYHTGVVTSSLGVWIKAGDTGTTGWDSGETINMTGRQFQLTLTDMPEVLEGKVSSEYMIIGNPIFGVSTTVIVTKSTSNMNVLGNHINITIGDVGGGTAIIRPYYWKKNDIGQIGAGATAAFNFLVF